MRRRRLIELPSNGQLDIHLGDLLSFRHDDDSMSTHIAASDPWLLGGHTWVIMITEKSGCVALCRCYKQQEVKAA